MNRLTDSERYEWRELVWQFTAVCAVLVTLLVTRSAAMSLLALVVCTLWGRRKRGP